MPATTSPHTAPAHGRRGNLAGLRVAAALAALTACASPGQPGRSATDSPAGGPGGGARAAAEAGIQEGRLKSLTGTLTGLDSASDPEVPVRPRTVAVTVPGGTERSFRVGDSVDARVWNLRHLRSHLRSGEAILVVYEETADGAVAVALVDQPAGRRA
jgi:hypothetical protein